MAGRTIYLDPPPYTWRSRKIVVEPYRWYARVELDREGYAESDHGADADLPAPVMAAVERVRKLAMDQLWLAGYQGSFLFSDDVGRVAICIDFRHIDRAVDALRSAELDHDSARLDALAEALALPVDDWLAPGERQLLRGIDFDVRPTVFLHFLRGKAKAQGLKLNGRATPDSVWVRPQLTGSERLSRQAFPEQYTDRPDRWSNASSSDGLRRPSEQRRNRNGSVGAISVELRDIEVGIGAKCPCGLRAATDEYALEQHRKHHLQWSLGVPVPKNVPWHYGNVALVSTQSSMAWRRLANRVALIPKRENGYDFPSWDVGESPAGSPRNKRAYLLRHGNCVVGYLTASDLDQHSWWNFDRDERFTDHDTSTRPCIDLIWVAAARRGKGVAGSLVALMAADFGCQIGDVSWSHPVSEAGERLARRISPPGIWVN